MNSANPGAVTISSSRMGTLSWGRGGAWLTRELEFEPRPALSLVLNPAIPFSNFILLITHEEGNPTWETNRKRSEDSEGPGTGHGPTVTKT